MSIIIGLFGVILNMYGVSITPSTITIFSILGFIITYILQKPSIAQYIKNLFCNYDWADETIKLYQSIPHIYRKSFWISFGLINLAFLFHTINFMWGGYDWQAVRTTVDSSQSLKDGFFSAYLLQNLLFDGKILPVINNLWSFLGLSLTGILLAIYFQITTSTLAIVVLTLIFSVTPYTLGWLYFTQNTLGHLWAPALSMIAILLSNKDASSVNKKYVYNLIAISLFIISLGTFFPVINFILITILGRILLGIGVNGVNFRKALSRQLQNITNLTAAILIYIFVILLLKDANISPNIYNISFIYVIYSIPATIKNMFLQFTTTLPFIGIEYKILYLTITLLAVFSLILKTPTVKSALKSLIMLPIILFASQLSTLFFVTNYHVVTVAFYSLPILYALMYSILIRINSPLLKRITYALAIIAIFSSFVRISYALKVWKFGFDAETKLVERIITRMERMPEFNVDNQYKLIQIGSKSLRSKYYLAQANETESKALLSLPYYIEGKAKDAYNFFYQADFVSEDASIDTIKNNKTIRDFIIYKARPYPAKESIFIHDDYIIFILDENALIEAQRRITEN